MIGSTSEKESETKQATKRKPSFVDEQKVSIEKITIDEKLRDIIICKKMEVIITEESGSEYCVSKSDNKSGGRLLTANLAEKGKKYSKQTCLPGTSSANPLEKKRLKNHQWEEMNMWPINSPHQSN